MPISPGRIDLLALGAIVLVALVLLFPRLDDRALWEDEAETALLAKNVLRFGLPLGWDGRDVISQECGEDLDRNRLWRQTPWLPIYLVAGSFRLLGADAFSARLPFVLLAAATLPSLWLLARRIFADRVGALVATTALALSVPFLLYARQCRYYSLVAFATVWTLTAFFAVIGGWRERIRNARSIRVATLALVIALSVLFHANYLVFVATIVGLLAAGVVLRPTRADWWRLGVAGALIGGLNAPWLLVFDVGGKTAIVARFASPAAFVLRLGRYVSAVELYMFPTLALTGAFVWALVSQRRRGAPMLPGLDMAAALFVFCLGYVVALSFTPLLFLRYLVGLLPVFALLTGYVVTAVARRDAVIAGAVLAVVLVVDRADLVRGAFGAPLVKYVDEITHDFEGPIEAVARFLAREARPGDRVFVTYGALGLRFHSSPALEVRGGTGCQPLDAWPPPEWLVVRWFFRLNPLAAAGREDALRVRDWVNARIVSGEYRRIELPTIDTTHDAIPEPDVHRYRTPRDGPRIAVWKRVPAPRGE